MHEVRAVTLSCYLEAAKQVGLDGYLMLREAGISPSALAESENKLPARAVARLIDRSARLSGCSSFGLLLADGRSFASAGPATLLLERVPRVGDVIEASIEFRRYFNDVVSFALEVSDRTAIVRVDVLPGFANVPTIDLVVAIAYRIIAGASGQQWQPTEVHLVRDRPCDLRPWKRNFPIPVQFNSSFNGFACSSAALGQQLPFADETMAKHARRMLHFLPLRDESAPVSDQVRRMNNFLHPTGHSTIDQIAAHLGMGARALQRALRREGCTFAEVVDEVRQELAEYYLSASSQSVTAISAHLGYSTPGAFTRWFTKKFGVAPLAWRRARNTSGG